MRLAIPWLAALLSGGCGGPCDRVDFTGAQPSWPSVAGGSLDYRLKVQVDPRCDRFNNQAPELTVRGPAGEVVPVAIHSAHRDQDTTSGDHVFVVAATVTP